MKLILGSTSPRRLEILNFFSFPFDLASPPFVEEIVPFTGDPINFATTISEGKAHSLLPLYPDQLILTADTVVYREGKVYGKPASSNEAIQMLSELQDGWHSVFTAMTLSKKGTLISYCEETKILFHPLSLEKIQRYQESIHTKDKAGGYAIQQAGSLIVKKIEGSYYNVMGLSINGLQKLFEEVGLNLWEYLK